MQKHTISAIIVVFNSGAYIKKCLDSLANQILLPNEIIIVDNNSNDDTQNLCKRDDLPITYIRNKENKGFCYANNQAIKIANSDWILCLNSDVFLKNNFLEEFAKYIPKLPKNTGGINPKVLNDDEKTIYANGLFLSRSRKFMTDKTEYKDLSPIWGANAAAAMYKKKMLDDIKYKEEYFDELFFFLAEDIDLSFRAKNLGWNFFHTPKMICTHTGNCSNHSDRYRTYLSFRNRYYLLLKNESIGNILNDLIFIAPYDLMRNIYLMCSNSLWFLALCDIIKNYKEISKKRKVQQSKKV